MDIPKTRTGFSQDSLSRSGSATPRPEMEFYPQALKKNGGISHRRASCVSSRSTLVPDTKIEEGRTAVLKAKERFYQTNGENDHFVADSKLFKHSEFCEQDSAVNIKAETHVVPTPAFQGCAFFLCRVHGQTLATHINYPTKEKSYAPLAREIACFHTRDHSLENDPNRLALINDLTHEISSRIIPNLEKNIEAQHEAPKAKFRAKISQYLPWGKKTSPSATIFVKENNKDTHSFLMKSFGNVNEKTHQSDNTIAMLIKEDDAWKMLTQSNKINERFQKSSDINERHEQTLQPLNLTALVDATLQRHPEALRPPPSPVASDPSEFSNGL